MGCLQAAEARARGKGKGQGCLSSLTGVAISSAIAIPYATWMSCIAGITAVVASCILTHSCHNFVPPPSPSLRRIVPDPPAVFVSAIIYRIYSHPLLVYRNPCLAPSLMSWEQFNVTHPVMGSAGAMCVCLQMCPWVCLWVCLCCAQRGASCKPPGPTTSGLQPRYPSSSM